MKRYDKTQNTIQVNLSYFSIFSKTYITRLSYCLFNMKYNNCAISTRTREVYSKYLVEEYEYTY